MQTHEIIAELVITNNTLSTLLETLINKGVISEEEFNKHCKDKLEISFPFTSSITQDSELRNKIQEYLQIASNSRYGS